MKTYIKFEKSVLGSGISFLRRRYDSMVIIAVKPEEYQKKAKALYKILKNYRLHDITSALNGLWFLAYIHKGRF